MRGCQAGAAYEALRRAMLGPTRTCLRCDARGVVGADGTRTRDLAGADVCPDCGGKGVVAAG
jgi:hypothetical protein